LSHIVKIQTQVKDAEAVRAACRRLGLEEPAQGKFRVFSTEVTGLAVKLPGWTFPVVCQADSGSLQYDNYGGAWGQPAELDKFLQAYATEKAKIEARKKGYSVSEQQLKDGSIKLSIHVGGDS
jgi:hypothetical protein